MGHYGALFAECHLLKSCVVNQRLHGSALRDSSGVPEGSGLAAFEGCRLHQSTQLLDNA